MKELRIDFHCHLFPPLDARKMAEAGAILFKGYGFYERMVKKMQNIKPVESSNIMLMGV